MKRGMLAIAMACAFVWSTPVSAQAPALLPVQGYLTGAGGTALEDGSYTIRFRLYDSADPASTSALHDETLDVDVAGGYFTVYLGDATEEPLDLAIFRDVPAVFLGIKVGADEEMVPRLQLASTAFAASASYCGDASSVGGVAADELARADHGHDGLVPAGAVMHFDLPACPEGWTELSAARGRTIVGLPAGGTSSGSVGTALSDLENRTHTHAVDPASANTSSGGAHTHSVNPPNTTSTSTGAHAHRWAYLSGAHNWHTWNPEGVDSLSVHHDVDGLAFTPGAGTDEWFPLGLDEGTASNDVGREWYTETAGAHTHDVNIAAFDSASEGAHTHTLDVPSTTSGTANTGNVMPYLQLRACRKD